jgi:AcrR family transcriptional regulator
MTDRRSARISSRKQPKQARSTELVAAILDAAVQVLGKEGATRFTTARVAEKAGVSIGSLYQYFPNKAAILFRLQSDEWQQTTDLLRRILEDDQRPPLERLRTLVHAFLRSECDEAAMRVAMTPLLSIEMRPKRRKRWRQESALFRPSCRQRCPRHRRQLARWPAS